jgi:hypothetical protein
MLVDPDVNCVSMRPTSHNVHYCDGIDEGSLRHDVTRLDVSLQKPAQMTAGLCTFSLLV